MATAPVVDLVAREIFCVVGTIPRCKHGTYDPHNGGEKALYCPLCSPEGPGKTRNVVLPVSSELSFYLPERRANKIVEGACPQCSSRVHIVVNEKTWECAECGERYKAPRKRRR